MRSNLIGMAGYIVVLDSSYDRLHIAVSTQMKFEQAASGF